MSDIVAIWDVPLSDRVHRIEFEHGTTTGKRIVRVDGEEIVKKEWMFKLVGAELFQLCGQANCEITINATSGFTYEYGLLVNGKQLRVFKEKQSKVMKTWMVRIDEDHQFRIVLEKDSLDIYVNGKKMDTVGEFAEDGTVIRFELEDALEHEAYIKTISSGNKKSGIIYSLIIDGCEVPECNE